MSVWDKITDLMKCSEDSTRAIYWNRIGCMRMERYINSLIKSGEVDVAQADAMFEFAEEVFI